MIGVLHFVPHKDAPSGIVARYRYALASDSYLALTHAEDTDRLPGTFQAARTYTRDIAPIHLPSRSEIAELLDVWDLVAPGLVKIPDWRPDSAPPAPERLHGLAAVAHKP